MAVYWYGVIRLLFGLFGQSTQTLQYPVQAFRATGVSAFPQPAPQVDQAQSWIPSSHIPYEFQFLLSMLVGMRMRPSGPISQRLDGSIVSCQPEVDGGARTVIFAGCSGYAMFQSIANEGLPVLHALCYSCHEGFALPFGLCFLTNLP